jgi:hypothetical protein
MHEPVQITVLEDEKIWGMVPRELAYTAAGACTALGVGFVLAAVLSGQWWFLAGTGLAWLTASALQSLSFHLQRLGYANADLVTYDEAGADPLDGDRPV